MNKLILSLGLPSVLWAATLMLCGCGGKNGGQPGPAKGGQTETSSATPPTLVLLGMQDYFNLELLDLFEKETGVRIDYQLYEEPDEVEPRLRSRPGSADLIVIDSFNLQKLRQLHLLRELDKSAVPNLTNADPKFLNLSCDPGNSVSVPYHWGTTLIAYRKDKLPNPVRSWKLLWDQALKGQVMMLNDSFEPMAVTMLLSGHSPETLDDAHYSLAASTLLDHLKSMDARYGDDGQVKSALLDGSVTAAMCYSGDAAMVAAEQPNVDFFIPEEGAMMWVDCMAIARDTRDPVAAHAFLNFFLRPEIAAANTNAIHYASTNREAEKLVDEELKNDQRLYPPPALRAKLQLVPQLDRERDALVNRHWYAVRRQVMETADPEPAEPAAAPGATAATAAAEPAHLAEEISQ